MSFELSLEERADDGWNRRQLTPSPESVGAALEKLASGVVGTLKLNRRGEELWASGGPEWFNVWAVTGSDDFFDLVGDREARGTRELVVGGQVSEVPARHCVPKEKALQAFWGFLSRGHLDVSDDGWERQGSDSSD